MALLNRDVWARGVLTRALAPLGTPSPAALQAVQSIARLESGGGYGVSGTSDPAWQGSNNWGAVKCAGSPRPPCPEGCFEHPDTDANGQVGIYCFRTYGTPEEGAAAFAHELYRRPKVAQVIASGSAVAIANAMHFDGRSIGQPAPYMALPAPAYARLIADRAKVIAKALGEPLYVTLSSPSSSAGLGELAASVLFGLAIAQVFRRRRRR